jgi:GH24 family phage-related lysozyme (muramidase)
LTFPNGDDRTCIVHDIVGLITGHEGKKSCVYKDSRGIPTIGIGFNLKVGGAKLAISNVGADYDKVLSGAQCLSDSQIMQLFEPSYEAAVYGAKGVVSSFNSLCCEVQAVMTDMAYNLGAHGESLSLAWYGTRESSLLACFPRVSLQ